MMTNRVSLRCLPPADASLLGDRHAWATVSAKDAARMIGVDPATFAAWRYRGLGPQALHTAERRREKAYRLSAILVWLGQRSGEILSETAIWREYLNTAGLGEVIEDLDDEELKAWIARIDPSARLD